VLTLSYKSSSVVLKT